MNSSEMLRALRQSQPASEARTALKLLARRPLQPTALSLSWYLNLIGL